MYKTKEIFSQKQKPLIVLIKKYGLVKIFIQLRPKGLSTPIRLLNFLPYLVKLSAPILPFKKLLCMSMLLFANFLQAKSFYNYTIILRP